MSRRYCFLLRVRPDRTDEYRRRHETVWPEMPQALADTGGRNHTLFLAPIDVHVKPHLRFRSAVRAPTL
jgi:L-rhamnose mutarotase